MHTNNMSQKLSSFTYAIIYIYICTYIHQCCKRLNIPVILEPPRINAAHEWDSAFITSTSRLVLPIDELTVQATGHMYQLPDHSVTYRLREQVLKDIVAASEPVL